ncbi:hypothetical protein O0L34_g2657 [Tuta absoluta]|nr:hypothetical protein O0L34_g2657 [Tuta absoluta]
MERVAGDRGRRHWRPNAAARVQMDIMDPPESSSKEEYGPNYIFPYNTRTSGALGRSAGVSPVGAGGASGCFTHQRTPTSHTHLGHDTAPARTLFTSDMYPTINLVYFICFVKIESFSSFS